MLQLRIPQVVKKKQNCNRFQKYVDLMCTLCYIKNMKAVAKCAKRQQKKGELREEKEMLHKN